MARLDTRLIRQYRCGRNDSTQRLCRSIFEGLGTDVSRHLSKALDGGDWETVLGSRTDPRNYGDPDTFRADYLAVNLLSKFPVKGYVSDDRRRELAIEKFLLSEEDCALVGQRLSRSHSVRFSTGLTAASYLHAMRRNICGDGRGHGIIPDFTWDDAEAYFGFGPGATTRLSRRTGDPYFKFQGIPETTANCEALSELVLRRTPVWRRILNDCGQFSLVSSPFRVVQGNRITTVPKSAKIDRVIAIEPDMNMFVQKGIGGWLRSHLLRRGCNLNDQTPNQELARLGSIDGTLCTIDLASASDSLAWSLCREVLPPSLVSAIELCRSEFGTLPCGKRILYRKVSSMGNGFTFELESMIFLSAILAIRQLHPEHEGPHRVYGDDLICPTTMGPILLELLEFIGFKPNLDKSFMDGPFRESCGKHYFRGVDVSPFYVRKPVDRVERLYWFHNQFILWLNRRSPLTPVVLDEWEGALIDEVIETIPSYYQQFGIPYGTPDAGTYLGSVGLFMCYDDIRCVRNRSIFPKTFKIVVGSGQCSTYVDDAYLCRQLYFQKSGRKSTYEEEGFPDVELPLWNGVVRKTRLLVSNKTTVYRWSDPYVRL